MKTVSGVTEEKMLEADRESIVGAVLNADVLTLKNRANEDIPIGNVGGLLPTPSLAPRSYSAKSYATTSIANSTSVAVPTWTDILGDLTLVSYDNTPPFTNFIIQSAGIFHINAKVTFASNATGHRIAAIYRNGVELQRNDIGCSTGFFTVQVRALKLLAVGDIITVRVLQNSGAALSLAATASSYNHCLSFTKY